MSHWYNLPWGGVTKEVNHFVNAWTQFNRNLEAKLGVKVIAFDPGVIVRDAREGRDYGPGVDLPLWLARRIVELEFSEADHPATAEFIEAMRQQRTKPSRKPKSHCGPKRKPAFSLVFGQRGYGRW